MQDVGCRVQDIGCRVQGVGSECFCSLLAGGGLLSSDYGTWKAVKASGLGLQAKVIESC